MSDLFDSAWLKWARAISHGHVLEAQIQTYGESDKLATALAIGKRYDPKRHGIVLYVERMDPLPDAWRVILGDIVHNYRSCLDNLAWALVSRGGTPPEKLNESQQRNVSFPIRGHRNDFNSAVKKTLPGVRRADIKFVRIVQPYHHAPSKQRRHCLALLRDLSNGDKHRTIQPMWALPEGATFAAGQSQDCIVRGLAKRAKRLPLEAHHELGILYVKKTGPDPDVELHGRVAVEPAVHPSVRLHAWLTQTAEYIHGLLRSFNEPPDDLVERIAIP